MKRAEHGVLLRLRRFRSKLLEAAAALVTTAVLHGVGATAWVEDRSWDQRMRWTAEQTPPETPIRLVTIDQETLTWAKEDKPARLGLVIDAKGNASSNDEQLHRGLYGILLDNCDKPTVVLFADTMFVPGRGDEAFARALAEPARPRVVLAASARHEDSVTHDGSWRAWPRSIPLPAAIEGLAPSPHATRVKLVAPPRALLGEADALGHVGSYVAQHRARRIPAFLRFDGRDLPALGLAAALEPGGRQPPLAARSGRVLIGTPPRHRLPLDHNGRVVPRYRSKLANTPYRYRFESAVDLFTITSSLACARLAGGSLGPELFVFVGNADVQVPTPVGPMTPMEVQATLLDNLLHDDFVRVAAPRWTWIAATLAAAVAVTVPRRRRWLTLVLVGPSLLGWSAAALGHWWPLVAPTLAAALALLARPLGRSLAPRTRPSGEPAFDVFLSYNGKNREAVIALAKALRARGLRPWLDVWQLVPGRPWHQAIEGVIGDVGAAAVLVGRDGLGPWETLEMRACLLQLVERGAPVIPVLLPGAPREPELPLFLRTLTWVDLRTSYAAEDLDRLVWGITGTPPPAR